MSVGQRLSPRQLTVVALAVAGAYYAGVQVGLALTFPPVTTSVLWPPNAILTATLLLVPVRYWWVCLGAALPVHTALELRAGLPPPLVASYFLTNCSEALIAAGGLRLLSDAPTRFDTFRRVALFIGVSAFAAPVLSSFADAGVANAFTGQPYWTVWRTRTFSNVLTELSVVPLVLTVAQYAHRPPARRVGEMAFLTAGLVTAAVWVFGDSTIIATVPGIPSTPSVLLLPFFFWTAVRFGVGGVSGALLTTAFVASYETKTGHRPFAGLSPIDSLIAVQFYLSTIAMPLMCVAGLLDERRRSAADLAGRLRFENLVSTITAAFVRPRGTVSATFDECLARMGEFLKADYVCLLQGNCATMFDTCNTWRRPNANVLAGLTCSEAFPWAVGRVLVGDTLVCEGVDCLPPNAEADRRTFQTAGIDSAVLMPLVSEGEVNGALSIVTLSPRDWSADDLAHLKLVAEVLANACARRRAELELQRSRQELAHVTRLSHMGELTASLAHQLNQPLAGILNNAQAARRTIDNGRASLTEIQDIVDDIIADDHRAASVIRRVQEMVTRTESPPTRVDANLLVDDVARLVASDAILRNVSVSFDLSPEPLTVVGNRIDLEQVLLNVLTNAVDAVTTSPPGGRAVSVRTTRERTGDVRIEVSDRGVGLPVNSEHRIFEPFFTMKPSGMGMGLAVARSLVEHNGGSIRAANRTGGGAVVTISLPGTES